MHATPSRFASKIAAPQLHLFIRCSFASVCDTRNLCPPTYPPRQNDDGWRNAMRPCVRDHHPTTTNERCCFDDVLGFCSAGQTQKRKNSTEWNTFKLRFIDLHARVSIGLVTTRETKRSCREAQLKICPSPAHARARGCTTTHFFAIVYDYFVFAFVRITSPVDTHIFSVSYRLFKRPSAIARTKDSI